MINKMLKASFCMALILSGILGFMWAIKTGYDVFPAVRCTVDAIGRFLMY